MRVFAIRIVSCQYVFTWCALAFADEVLQSAPASEKHLGGFAHVSERVLKDLLHRDVKLTQTIAESMMNMTTRGTARVDCKIGLELVPNPYRANLRLTLTGQALMDDAVG